MAAFELITEAKPARLRSSKAKNGKSMYAWNTHDYLAIDHPAFHDWQYGAHDSQGNPVLLKADLRVHPEAYEYLNHRLGKETGVLEHTTIGRGMLVAAREAKGVLLFGHFFHVSQEALRAIMTGISPFGVEGWDLRTDPVLSYKIDYSPIWSR